MATLETDLVQDPLAEYPNVKKRLIRDLNGTEIVVGDSDQKIRLDTNAYIGKGLFTVTFRGESINTHEPIAIKIHFPKPGVQIPEATLKDNLKSECELLRTSKHPNIAKFYATFDTPRGHYPAIAREYLPQSLKPGLSLEDTTKFLEQIGSATKYLLDEKGVLVTDLAIPQIGRRDNGDFVLYDLNGTTKSPFLGIDEIYTDPVVQLAHAAGKEIPKDERSLVYSLALCAYTLLGGEIQLPNKHLTGDRITLSKSPGVSDELLKVLEKASSPDINDRQKTLVEFIQDFKAAIDTPSIVQPLPATESKANEREIKDTLWINYSAITVEQAMHFFPQDLKAERVVLLPDLCPGRSPIPTGCVVELDPVKNPEWRKFAVGDIGCGIQLFEPETPLTWEDFEDQLSKWDELFQMLRGKGSEQGSLGGGNHFLDAVVPNDGNNKVMFVVHTGSRNEAKLIADLLHDLPNFDSEYDKTVAWAKGNRDSIKDVVAKIYGRNMKTVFDRSHNNVEILPNGHVLIRKGAVKLSAGETALIPSTMADPMALVTATSEVTNLLDSMSHGTGRVMSRRDAKDKARQLGSKYFTDLRHRIHIPETMTSQSFANEAPYCYRGIDEGIALLGNTIKVVTYLSPIAYLAQA